MDAAAKGDAESVAALDKMAGVSFEDFKKGKEEEKAAKKEKEEAAQAAERKKRREAEVIAAVALAPAIPQILRLARRLTLRT